MSAGPLAGRVVLELGGLGPMPFAGMLLTGLGAEVIRIERPGADLTEGAIEPRLDLLNRGKKSVELDLKDPRGVDAVLTLAAHADGVMEGYRPGVVERLGVGPQQCLERNPRLVYGRMTGWGQDGPLAHTVGHDLNFVALTGALHAIGEPGAPPPVPLNLIGDMGGGGTFLVMGMLAGMLEAERTGTGRIIDAAIVDGTVNLLAIIHSLVGSGSWSDERGTNVLSGQAPHYGIYETSDAKYMAVASVERRFYTELLDVLGLDADPADQLDTAQWPGLRAQMVELFRSNTRDHWTALFEGRDACVSPVLSVLEAGQHPQLRDRGSLVEIDGVLQTAPAPRFDGASDFPWKSAPTPGEHTDEVLRRFGVTTR